MLTKTLIICMFFALTLFAEEVQIAADKDNTLFETTDGSKSNGIGPDLFSGRTNSTDKLRRALVHFDIAGNVPAGAIITSISLSMTVNKVPSGGATANFKLHKVSADWGEGTSNTSQGSGADATPNDATWLHAFSPSTLWSTPGGDFNSSSSGSTSISGTGSYSWSSTPEMVADAQTWLDAASSNFGWIVIGGENATKSAKSIDSREGNNGPTITVNYDVLSSVNEEVNNPKVFALSDNFPNPFNPSTTIKYQLAKNSDVELAVYNLTGQKVAILVSGAQVAGNYNISFDAKNLASGIYFYSLKAGSFSQIKQMVLIK